MLKKTFSIIIALVLLLYTIAAIPSAAYQKTSYHFAADNLKLYYSSEGTYILSYTGSKSHIEKLLPDTLAVDLQPDHTIMTAGVFKSVTVLLSSDIPNDQLIIYTYRADTDVFDSFAIRDVRCCADCGFYYDGSCIYLVSENKRSIINRYNTSGKLLDSYTFGSNIIQLGTDYRGNLFAVCGSTLYRMNGSRFSAISGTSVTAPVTFFTDTLMIDSSGRILNVSNAGCTLLFKIDTGYGQRCACLVDDTVYCPTGDGLIYGYDCSTGQKRFMISLDTAATDIFAYNGTIYALGTNSSTPVVTMIRADEFTDIMQESAHTSITGDSAGPIRSAVYQIDYNSYSINGIPSGTTLAQLKSNIGYDGYEVGFYRDGSQISVGKCGTAMTAVFSSSLYRYTFELSVIGDLTGEGNVNSRDLSLLMKYLIGTASFNGVYLTSADLSEDGAVDVKDLAMMHRMQ